MSGRPGVDVADGEVEEPRRAVRAPGPNVPLPRFVRTATLVSVPGDEFGRRVAVHVGDRQLPMLCPTGYDTHRPEAAMTAVEQDAGETHRVLGAVLAGDKVR